MPEALGTTPGRSRNMAAIKRAETKPEKALRSALHQRGHRFRKDFLLRLPRRKVRPDIAFTRRKVAIFVDGCFWHSCPQHGVTPRKNTGYWNPKLEANVARDRACDDALVDAGWTVLRVWEHEDVSSAVLRIEHVLEASP